MTQAKLYTDPNINIDINKGLPRFRETRVKERNDTVELDDITSQYGGYNAATTLRSTLSVSLFSTNPEKPRMERVSPKCITHVKE